MLTNIVFTLVFLAIIGYQGLITLKDKSKPIPRPIPTVVVPECQPYDHCSGEEMDINALIESAKTKTFTAELSPYQKWAISLGYMLTQLNQLPYGKLSLSIPQTPGLAERNLKQGLISSWDITDRSTTLATLDWLANQGHSLDQYKAFYLTVKHNPGLTGQQIVDSLELDLNPDDLQAQKTAFDSVIKNQSKTGNNLIYAWDYGRFIFVTQAAYTVGYLTESEALVLIEEVGKRVRTRFHSWQEFGDNYVVGRLWWNPNQPGFEAATNQLYRNLIMPSGRWSQIPWSWSE